MKPKGQMTQQELAQYMNIPRTTLWDWWKRNNVSIKSGMTYFVIGYTVANFQYIR